MSVAYRLRHENGNITEVTQTGRLMALPKYRQLHIDADGIPVYEAPKEHVNSKPVKSGQGVVGRLLERRENSKERAEFLDQLPKNVELKQSFDEWKAARETDKAQLQSSTEYYAELESNSETISEAEYERRQSEHHDTNNQDQADSAARVMKTREVLAEKVSLHSNGNGYDKIIAVEAQSELDALNEQYDENGYSLNLSETGDESS
ncbi:hypothetical protein [Vibrio parahaemolyticus]|uniref:hypothetical protein n=1 Tax=Vibrio parahaemolyticus TaxID=670 RepID=UPI003298F081